MGRARLVVLTGASGSGKTSVAREVGRSLGEGVSVRHFDSIGVPSPSAMVAGWGSGERWQRATTLAWLDRLAAEAAGDSRILFEGQMRPRLLAERPAATAGLKLRPVLLDCDDETRRVRLVRDRAQPELANDDMMRWAALMRREAAELGWEVLDTSAMPMTAVAAVIAGRLTA